MNIDEAKKLSLPDLLAKLGHVPDHTKKGGQELWYVSPFRSEKTPSLHVSPGRTGIWIWKDFGDIGGTVLDFVMRYQGYTQIRDALTFLEDMYRPTIFSRPAPPSRPPVPTPPIHPPFSFHQQKGREAAKNFSAAHGLEFIDARPLNHFVAINYLTEERHIPTELAQQYLALVRYRNLATGKEYFGIGMKNQAGGFEVRSASSKQNFKSALIARDISVIAGTTLQPQTVHVFEGMIDFLSYLVLTRTDHLRDDALILHSVSSLDRAVAHIQAQNYQEIRTYLDNDKAGQQATERLKAAFGAKVLPQGEAFAPHHDLNDMLRAQHTRQKTRPMPPPDLGR